MFKSLLLIKRGFIMNLTNQQVVIFLLIAFLLSGCELFGEQKKDTTGTIFGTWELEEIRYNNGETLTPNPDEPYWFKLKEDSVFAEQEYHYSLEGQSYCNSCFGYYDYDEKTQEITIAFICNRLVCGIATEFASAVATSFQYSFSKGNLNLFFETAIEGKGHIILSPKQ
jgi:heat shock protein HslJ